MTTKDTLRAYDEALLRQAFDVARRAREGGDHPFGAVLADSNGTLLMEQGNGYSSEGGDRTAHAERLLASRAARVYSLEDLAEASKNKRAIMRKTRRSICPARLSLRQDNGQPKLSAPYSKTRPHNCKLIIGRAEFKSRL